MYSLQIPTMNYYALWFLAYFLIGGVLSKRIIRDTNIFDKHYQVTWGKDHVLLLNQGKEIQLSMDNTSGAGFESKLGFGSGFFNLRIKLPPKDSAGVVTAYYLSSYGNNHDELDFEFLGNRPGKPITLQTNVFANGLGNREQRTYLWFDPTADFHNYQILWNPHQIVFLVDEIPIRVYKNKTKIGVEYPSKAMHIEVSLWNGESWATDGGKTKTNWSYAPFQAHFQGFSINGCSSLPACSSANYWWNARKYWKLDAAQQKTYQDVRRKYLTYDYCSDTPRFPTPPPECPQ
ncbi:xyloglucan endotransglucosylase/hydrolase protein 2-like [Mercurialis annua]|uniref:xyloglucan endotransglucosylase/hydrolase protein 2-like n=1 Tax=Mercurialis annua TaxID=3986 RepID=UPI00215F1EE9|nr:xyloglucan endotransglucosylase/hydrolase protein 2-like [Mercurialis annua]